MARRLRYFPDRPLVEVTARTVQGRFLLKPTAGMRETFIGLLARAAERYDVEIHAFVCLSNHFHLLCSPADAHQLAAFMCLVDTNISKEAGKLHRWRGPLLQRRYQAIVVSEEELAQVGRLRYLLAHGVKESLVGRVTDWPGAHCAAALLGGEPPVGVWVDRTQQHAARHRGEDAADADFATTYRLELAPLPCWRNLSPHAQSRQIAQLVAEVEAEAAERHRRAATRALGAAGVLRQDPHDWPGRSTTRQRSSSTPPASRHCRSGEPSTPGSSLPSAPPPRSSGPVAAASSCPTAVSRLPCPSADAVDWPP